MMRVNSHHMVPLAGMMTTKGTQLPQSETRVFSYKCIGKASKSKHADLH